VLVNDYLLHDFFRVGFRSCAPTKHSGKLAGNPLKGTNTNKQHNTLRIIVFVVAMFPAARFGVTMDDGQAKDRFRASITRVLGKRNRDDAHLSLLGSATVYSRKAYLLTCSKCIFEDFGAGLLKSGLAIMVADGTHYSFDVVHATAPDVWPGLAVLRIGSGQAHGNLFMRAQPPYQMVPSDDTNDTTHVTVTPNFVYNRCPLLTALVSRQNTQTFKLSAAS
jgi:hypothetical protein